MAKLACGLRSSRFNRFERSANGSDRADRAPTRSALRVAA
jgi:hypothetical protein